jgi:hypothetical protein
LVRVSFIFFLKKKKGKNKTKPKTDVFYWVFIMKNDIIRDAIVLTKGINQYEW